MRPYLTLVLLLVTGVTVPAFGQDSKEQQLQTFFVRLAEAAQAGDKAGYTGLFEASATMFLPHRSPLLGREQIGDWFDSFRGTVVLVVDSYEQEQVDIVGDVAMVRSRAVGHYLVRSTGEHVPFDQKYLDILRYRDGRWYMAYHVASSSTFEPGLWDRAWEGK